MKTLKARSLFFELGRVQKVEDTGHLFVEGYTFVHPDAGDGFVWERSAMEAATPDYQQWGAIREMHQASAVGNASGSVTIDGAEIPLGVQWDQKGAFLRALIVDPVAIEKVETGVYKGFSAKIKPLMMRGNSVKSCTWIENSLVDRPQDKGCAIERLDLMRVEDADKEEFEVEEELTEDQQRAANGKAFKDKIKAQEGYTLANLAFDTLRWMMYEIQESGADDRESQARDACNQFRDYIAPIMARLATDEGFERILKPEEFNRGITSQTPNLPIRENLEGGRRFERCDDGGMTPDQIVETLNDFQSRIETAEADQTKAKARIEELERMAKPELKPPVRFPEAMERTFTQAQQQGHTERMALQEELKRIESLDPSKMTEKERTEAATQMQRLKGQLQAL